ncbi:MAG TPA: hypothetical protein PLN21_02595 [Gemmatales bacterium]|nr:hypothetical protein [Gemmatales bacterium]
MEWFIILGGLFLANHFEKASPSPPTPAKPVRTIRSVRRAYKNNLWMINRLPLAGDEREAAREAARQKMLKELAELMS